MKQQTSASKRLLNLPELLEMVLLAMPPRCILQAQRVNHAWNELIARSPKIQRALFFRPITDDTLRHDFSTLPTEVWNCKNRKRCGDLRFTNDVRESNTTQADQNTWIKTGEAYRGPITVNPMLFESDTLSVRSDGEGDEEGDKSWTFNPGTRNLSGDRATPSWRKMAICQPPLGRTYVDHDYPHCHVMDATDPGVGIRGGDIIKAAKDFGTEEVTICVSDISMTARLTVDSDDEFEPDGEVDSDDD